MFSTNQPEHFFDQDTITNQISNFLTALQRDEALIKKFKFKGYCSGYTILALYAMWLQFQPRRCDHNGCEIPRDDWDWLKQTVKIIFNWNGDIQSLTAEDCKNIDRFISLMEISQDPDYLCVGQGQLDKFLQDTRGRVLKQEYSLAGSFTCNQLTKPINTSSQATFTESLLGDVLAQEARLILISSHNHDTGLFYYHKQYYYFDPRYSGGFITFSLNKTRALAKEIFAAHKFKLDWLSPLGFRVFTFGTPLTVYPKQEIILSALAGENVVFPNSSYINHTPLHKASFIGCLASLKFYLSWKKIDINAKDCHGMAAIHYAAQMNYLDIITALTVKGADINIQNGDNETALYHAAQQDVYLETVEALIQAGANLDIPCGDDGATALHLAAQNGCLEIVKALIEAGANLDIPCGDDGATALHLAAQNGYLNIIKALIRAGAKVDIPLRDDGETPLYLAAKNNNNKIVKYLLKHGANPFTFFHAQTQPIPHPIANDHRATEPPCVASHSVLQSI